MIQVFLNLQKAETYNMFAFSFLSEYFVEQCFALLTAAGLFRYISSILHI